MASFETRRIHCVIIILRSLHLNCLCIRNLSTPYYYVSKSLISSQVTLQPSHTVIARPSSDATFGGEASVGAALSVSDTGASSESAFDEELLALLGQGGRSEESRQTYVQAPVQTQTQTQTPVQSVAPQYQQVMICWLCLLRGPGFGEEEIN